MKALIKRGRFYWPGLAAFAAKQVVDGIELADKTLGSLVGQARLMAGVSYYYLLKGNFWVFVEVTTWMNFYKQYGPELFDHCVDRRDVDSYDPVAKELMQKLPWAKGGNVELKKSIEKRLRVFDVSAFQWSRLPLNDGQGALAEINNCKATGSLKDGFTALKMYESDDTDTAAQHAYNSAAAFLIHEQTLHLQKMVYDHEEFQFALQNNDLGRYLWHMLGARDPEIVFNASASIGAAEEQQLAAAGLTKKQVIVRMELEDGKLYVTKDRMKYVESILKQYHYLMTIGRNGQYRPYMIQQLRTIAAWANA